MYMEGSQKEILSTQNLWQQVIFVCFQKQEMFKVLKLVDAVLSIK